MTQIREQASSNPEVGISDGVSGRELIPKPPRCQGEVAGEVIPQRGNAKSLKELLATYPMPKVWLVFHQNPEDCIVPLNTGEAIQRRVNVQLPRDAKRLLRDLWATACTHYYYQRLGKRDLNKRKERARAMTIANHNVSVGLMELTIQTPEGKREISQDEAFALMRYINAKAQALISNLYGNNKGDIADRGAHGRRRGSSYHQCP